MKTVADVKERLFSSMLEGQRQLEVNKEVFGYAVVFEKLPVIKRDLQHRREAQARKEAEKIIYDFLKED